MTRRVLIAGGGTGGHLMPALAVADALRDAHPHIEPVLVGAERGVERHILPTRPYRYHLLPAEPLYRRQWWKNARWAGLVWRLYRACGALLDAEAPAAVLGTGGYAAGPILFRAARRGIPVLLQEQNARPGTTTRWLSRRARQIYLGFPEARNHLRIAPDADVFAFGNPITPPPEPRPERAAARQRLAIPPGAPVVLVAGGSQGARSINRALAAGIARGWWDRCVLLWSTGHGTWSEFKQLDAPPLRQLRPFWDPMAHAYAAADLAVTRAGAMTTAELCAWGLPAVLIPLPTAAADHQSRNAEALARAGAMVHLPERELTPEFLWEHASRLLEHRTMLGEMRESALQRGRPNAARSIADRIAAIVS
jgi:UDP-N-acetylglucosamine--N-acetylmuramyl-(pentapeptide) pyrophosphoryl-undecaprenol N-acetylglucosamine transferase